MKLLKTLTVAAMAAAAVAGSASAQTTANPLILHIAGSTAFRGTTTVAVIDYLAGATSDGTIGDAPVPASSPSPVYGAYDSSGANATKATYSIFANGTIGTGGVNGTATIIVECSWTGSLSGVVDAVTQQSHANFLDETTSVVENAVNSGAITNYDGETVLPSTPFHSTNQVVHMAMSDSNKSTIAAELATGSLSGTIGTYSSTTQIANAIKGSALEDAGVNFNGTPVAIVPFEWVLGSTNPKYTAVTNITQQAARALFNEGSLPQSFFTGTNTAADTTNFIYLTGRDEDSGTRIGALAESQNGVTTGTVKQYTIGDGSSNYTTIGLFPANSTLFTEPQISWAPAGHSGYVGGPNVQYALNFVDTGATLTFADHKAAGNTGASYFVGYLGLGDAHNAVGAATPATILTYNGVPFSYTGVENGSYTFWTYEHCYRLASHDGDAFGNAIDTIADLIAGCDADVSYSATGGVTHNYNAGNYTSGYSAAGLFNNLNVNRSTTEGLPVTH